MGILRDFEQRLEGAVEGFFARAFRSGLQPVELAKAIQRYAGNYKQVGIDGVFVPNVYRFDVAPADMERFSGFSGSLQRELTDVVTRTARQRGWKLQGPAKVELRASDDVRVGTYELRGKVEASELAPAATPPAEHPATTRAGAGEPAVTTVLPVTQRDMVTLRVLSGPSPGARFEVSESAVIGRLPDCDVTLPDPSVSRRHASLTRHGDVWTVEDLGSTNGVRVNGEPVGRHGLRDGDRLELGSVNLAFSVEG